MVAATGPSHDVIVIGTNLEALAAAVTLARAGRDVLILDHAHQPGGPLAPVPLRDTRGGDLGRWGAIAPMTGRTLSGELIRTLELERFGLRLRPMAGPMLVSASGPALHLERDPHVTAHHLNSLKAGEGPRLLRLRTELGRARRALQPFLNGLPVDPGRLRRDGGAGAKDMLNTLASLGSEAAEEALHLASVSVSGRLREDLHYGLARTLIAADALSGQSAGPMAPGTGLALLDPPWLAAEAGGFSPLHFGAAPAGGAVALANALERSVMSSGARLRLGTEVAEILVKDGKVRGVALADGMEIQARSVISGYDAKRTLLNLVNWKAVPEALLRRVSRLDATASVARMAVALGHLDFLPRDILARGPADIHIAPSIQDMERAVDSAREGIVPSRPWLTVSFAECASSLSPSQGGSEYASGGGDQGLAAPGTLGRVMMISVHHVPWRLREGDWSAQRKDGLRNDVLATIAGIWPGFMEAVEQAALWLPQDLEASLGRTGGLLTAGEWAPDRLYWNGPLPELSRHLTPLHGLALCGPDTAVMPGADGQAGLACAEAVLGLTEQPGRVSFMPFRSGDSAAPARTGVSGTDQASRMTS